jgi:DNA-binding NarL/FixJ family response regulator/tRNA A-37 threonylcarbamoyl transferase component Bud32
MSHPPSVLLVEDNALIMAGLSISLERMHCCRIVCEVGDGEAAVRESERLHPDVILMDVGLPGIDGIEATWRIKQSLPRTRIIMFTSHTTPEDVTAALGAGADGYCSKDTPAEQIAVAITTVMRGEIWLDPNIADVIVRLGDIDAQNGIELSDTELQILDLIKRRVDNHQIALKLNISPEKVANVMQRLIHHLMVKSEPEQMNENVEAEATEEKSHEWLMAFVENLKNDNIFAARYVIETLLGSGTTGAVFKARHLYMDRYVALKLLRPEYAEDRLVMRKFQREATAIGKLKHPNIVGVYDFGMSSGGEPYLAMEYVDGIDLADILEKEGRLSAPRVIDICIQVAAGLAEAHLKGIIHCDLKPSNILILGEQPQELVKVVDFGLAEIVPRGRTGNSDLTAKFLICGTPNYMSPEQCYNKPLGTLSDVYSLGCIMYESLTGVKIFDGESPGETIARQCQLVPPPMSTTYPGSFSPKLEDCVSKMLAKDPSDRPQSMDEVTWLLRSVLQEQTEAVVI